MDDKKKIILGSKDFISKGLGDIFINVNLQQTFNQIKKDKYDNNFDLAEQFRKERNNSRNFRIYGIIDSNIIHTDTYPLYIYKDSGLTQWITTIDTTPLVYEEKNIFNKKRGKYLLELDNYDADSVFIKIFGNNITYGDQIFEQKLVYHTLDGDFVEYGTETVDIGLNNSGFLSIENNFPFFYNKHWIKKDIEILETKKAIVNFLTEETNINEGDSVEITIGLDKPSPFGNETIDLKLNLVTAKESDYSISLSGTPILTQPTGTTTFSWNIGEQFKTFEFTGLNDYYPEFSESLFINMSNLQFVDSGLTISHIVNINDETPRKYANFNFGETYRNRYNFTGRTYNDNGGNIDYINSFSVLRNGLKFERRNEEFYPNDTYKLIITNDGNDTIFPINNSLNILSEEIFLAHHTKSFNLSTKYTGNQLQKLKIILSGSGHSTYSSNIGNIIINGVNFYDNTGSEINYSGIKQALINNNTLTQKNLEIPWTFEFNDSKLEVTITSKSPGVPVDVSFNILHGPGATPTNLPINQNLIPIIEEIDQFIFYEQIPLVVNLAANSDNNSTCSYQISINKAGFRDFNSFPKSVPASIVGTNNFLITNIKNVMRAWDNTTQECVYVLDTTTQTNQANSATYNSNGVPNPVNFIMPVGQAYINGTVLFSNNQIQGHQNNETFYELQTGFYTSKLAIKSCTNDSILNNSIKQKTKITIPGIGSGNVTMQQLLVNNANAYRSFDFRTGTTGSFTTFSNNNSTFWQYLDMSWKNNVALSGGQFAVNPNGLLGNVLDYGYTATNLPTGPVKGFDINNNPLTIYDNDQVFYLESKVAGVPFEIVNIVNAYVVTSDFNIFGQSVTAGDILGPILVEQIIPNGIAGIDPNPSKNWMGGFNTTLQLVP